MQRACKCGFTLAMFLLGTALPANAQDEVTEDAAVETVAPKKKAKKQAKQYPMVEVSGTVTDAATGEPLAGVQLQSYNNNRYTAMTDENGQYTISVPTFVTSLTIKLEGYNQIQTAINGRTERVDAALYSDRFLGDYRGSASARKSVKTNGIENSNDITIDQQIQKQLGADVHSISRSGLPGEGMSMFINGLNSLNSNAQPLIILDGVVYDMLYDESSMLHSGYYNNLLQGINLNDIESVEVLKNATAIYGAKAANGVILINTKRVKSMATRIDVNLSAGVELRPKTLDMMDAGQYRNYASEMLAYTGTKMHSFNFLNNTTPYYYNTYHNETDWKKEVYREAFTQNYGIAIQGGDDVAGYNLSVGYTRADGTLKKNSMERFNIRFNTDIKLNKWFSTQFDAAYTNVTRNLRDDGLSERYGQEPLASTSFLAYAKAPFLSPYDYSLIDGSRSEFLADADVYLNEVIGTKGSLANPSAILANGEAKNKNHSDCTMINVTVAPKWQPTKNFFLEERFSYTMQSFDESYFTPVIGMPDFNLPNRGMVQNSKQSIYSKHNSVFSDTRADWQIPLGAHRLYVFGGIRFMNDTYTSSVLEGYNTGNDKTPNASMSLLYRKPSGVDNSWRTLAYYANIDYNYQEKYYLTAQLSLETSSRFGKQAKGGLRMFGVEWGVFPSVNAAWVMSNEKWFKPNKGVNFLKLNVGFESVGNDNINNTGSLTYMASSSMFSRGATEIGLVQIGNPTLRWETTNRLNAGIEGNFINNRLNVRFNYYKSWTSNLVTLGTLAYVAGLTDYYTNDGKMQNEGFDFGFDAKIVNMRKFKFELGASVGHYKNKITQLPQGMTSFTSSVYGDNNIISQVGGSAGQFYGWKTEGVFATAEEAAAANLGIKDKTGNVTPFRAGDMHFVDVNGDHLIDDKDRQVLGNPNPDIYGNVRANFYFGSRWSVGLIFNYSLGNDIYNYQRSLLEGGSAFMNQTKALTRRWIAEGQKTDIPHAEYGDPMGNSRMSDRWIEDGSYFKFKTLTVNYKIPLTSPYIQGISIWAAANNLFTLTKYLGADPELSCGSGVLYQGIDAGYLSMGRSFHLGVKINL